MASFFIPLSGLNADSKALNTIANNLSNMNTTAYKSEKTNFADLFYQEAGTTGAGDPSRWAAACAWPPITPTTRRVRSTPAARLLPTWRLDGNGFFVVNDGTTNFLTRNGAFTQNAAGDLVTATVSM